MHRARTFLIFLLAFLLANGPFLQIASQSWVPFTSSVAWAVEVDLQFLKGTQITQTQAGVPYPSGKVYILDAGTEDQRTTYSDLNGTIASTTDGNGAIVLDINGRFTESVYVPVGSWKIRLDTSADVTVFTEDNIEGALDTAALSVDFARPLEPVQIVTSATTLTSGQLGNVINADATGGAFTITLLSAVTAGDGKGYTIRRSNSTGGVISITTTGGETINGSGNTIQLSAVDGVFKLVSDGANWSTLTSTGVAPGSITTSELNAGVAGLLQKVGSVIIWPGTKAGGNTCPAGYLEGDGAAVSRATYAELYNLYSNDGASAGIYGDGDASTTFNVPDYRGRFLRHLDGTAGLDPDKAARTDRGDGTVGNNLGTLQAEDYLSHLHDEGTLAWSQATGTISGTAASAGSHSHGVSGGSQIGSSSNTFAPPGGTTGVTGPGTISIDSGGSHTHSVSGSATTTGTITGDSGSTGGAIGAENRPDNIYVLYCVLASPTAAAGSAALVNTILTGSGVPSGSLGQDGDLYYDTASFILYTKNAGAWSVSTSVIGPTGVPFTFDASADTATDPGLGNLRLNNADVTLVTQIAVDDTTNASGNPDISAFIATLADSTSTIKGSLKISHLGHTQHFTHYDVTGLTDQTGFTQLAVTFVDSDSATPFTAADQLSFEFSRTGDLGTQGATGATGTDPGIRWDFDVSTSMAEPGDGDLRLNNATLASVTLIAVDDNSGETGNPDASAWVLAWDDLANSGARGTLIIAKAEAPENFAIFNVTGASTDNTTWVQVAVTHIASAGSFSDTDALSVHFTPAGADGSMTGPGSSTDNAIVRFDGTGGATTQNSGVTIDDSDNLNTTGELRESGTPVSPIGQQTMVFRAAGMNNKLTGGAAPNLAQSGGGSGIVRNTFAFDQSTDECVQFDTQLPVSYDGGTMIVQFLWFTTATSGNVIWTLAGGAAGDDDPTAMTFGTAVSVTDGAGGANSDLMISAESSALTLSGTPAAGEWAVFELCRDADDGSDTLAADAMILIVRLHYTTNAATDD